MREEPRNVSQKKTKVSSWGMHKVLKKIDAFGEPLPSFNIKGEDHVYTLGGGVITMLITIVVLAYAAVKFEHLTSRYSPNMSSYLTDIGENENMNLTQRNFRIAFSIENYNSPKFLKNDTDYVRWLFRIYGQKDNERYEEILPYHVCTEEDFAEFHPIAKSSALLYQSMKEDQLRGFLCIDWDSDTGLEIYGNENASNYQRISVDLLPCNVATTNINELPEIDEKCNRELEQQKQYMANSHWLMLVNEERFNPQKFGDESIEYFSEIKNAQFDENVPTWMSTNVQKAELQDDVELFQLGISESTEFVYLTKDVPQVSTWNIHPSVNAKGRYKFTGLEININLKSMIITRNTYDMLSYLGDVGGLTDMLFLMAQFIVKPFTGFTYSSTLLAILFRLLPKDNQANSSSENQGGTGKHDNKKLKKVQVNNQEGETEDLSRSQFKRMRSSFMKQSFFSEGENGATEPASHRVIVKKMKQSFGLVRRFEEVKVLQYGLQWLFSCCVTKRQSQMQKHKQFTEKVDSILTKELDLQKFLVRQRLLTNGIMALLTGKQSYLVGKMSQLTIRESSDFSNTSFDEELSDQVRENPKYYRDLVDSKDIVDQRLINLYMLSQASQQGLKFGFNNDVILKRQKHSMKPQQLFGNNSVDSQLLIQPGLINDSVVSSRFNYQDTQRMMANMQSVPEQRQPVPPSQLKNYKLPQIADRSDIELQSNSQIIGQETMLKNAHAVSSQAAENDIEDLIDEIVQLPR